MRHHYVSGGWAALLVAWAFNAACAVTFDRKLERTVDFAIVPDADLVTFHQNESVTLDLTVLRDGQPAALTNSGMSALWQIMAWTNQSSVLIAKTGAVTSVVSGAVTSQVLRFTLTPDQSGMTNGLYDGWVTVQVGSGSGMTDYCVIHRQAIEMRYTP